MQERERERDVVAGTFGSSEERTREGNVIAGRLDVEWMVKRCSPREKNEKGGRGERKVDKKGASRRGKKGRRRKLRGGSNHRRILWDHNSGCCRYHRAVEVLEDSFLPSIHPPPPPLPVLIRNPSGDPPFFYRWLDEASCDRNCFAACHRPPHPCRYETTRLLIKRSFEGESLVKV